MQPFAKKNMKKIFQTLLIIITLIALTACAKTGVTDMFRFELSKVNVELGVEKEIDVILGSNKASDVLYEEKGDALGETEGSKLTIVENKGKSVVVKALEKGTTYLKAYVKNSNSFDIIKVNINEKVVDYIKINASSDQIYIGETVQLTTVFSPQNESTKAVYESSNPKVITVDENGLVKAVGVGSAYVKVYDAADPEFFGTKAITVKYFETAKIELIGEGIVKDGNKYSLTLYAGERYQLSTISYGADGTTNGINQRVDFTSSRAAMLSVSSTGLLYAKKTYSSAITVNIQSKDKKVKLTLSVKIVAPTEFEQDEIGMLVDEEIKFSDELFVNNLKGEIISGDDVVELSSDLTKVKALKLGEAYVRIYNDTFSKEVKITVKEISLSVQIFTLSSVNISDYVANDNTMSVEVIIESFDGNNGFEVSIDDTEVAEVVMTENGFDIVLKQIGKFDLKFTSGAFTRYATITVK